eukprot:CAMPEP_0174738486 /NCGR_PEP_ID=MMETSP1094-20130205/70016_1 /TAXON_ID=156173 /ORGANISM="Chrysochromulina brevifilum, Strain UTEX LB 985" /LENGTH=71 /DNA_ID=CAMNT_0015941907 /DNA_START=145 /DNA_END=358 /DNA_ORIENTATION=-
MDGTEGISARACGGVVAIAGDMKRRAVGATIGAAGHSLAPGAAGSAQVWVAGSVENNAVLISEDASGRSLA